MVITFYSLSALVNFLTSAVLGIFVISKSRKEKNVSFFFFCFFVGLWSLSYFAWQISTTAEQALMWCRILMAFAIFIPVAYLHFVYAMVDIAKKKRAFLLGSYAVFALFLFADPTPYFISGVQAQLGFTFWPIAGPLYSVFLLIWFFYVIYSSYLLYTTYRTSAGIIRSQIRYVFLGMVIGFIGGSTNYFLWYRIPIPPVANIFVSFYVGSIAYAIIVYRLMDIRVILRKTFIYITSSLLVYVSFYLIIGMYEKFFGGPHDIKSYLTGVIVAPLFVLIFAFANNKIQLFANRYLFYSLYTQEGTASRLIENLTRSINLQKIVDSIIASIQQAMQLDQAAIIIVDEKKDMIAKNTGFEEKEIKDILQYDFLKKYLAEYQTVLVRDELQIALKNAQIIKDKPAMIQLVDTMKKAGISLCLPMTISNKLVGMILLGNKVSNDGYNREDLELLTTISKQAAVSIDNAWLYKKIDEKNKYLQELISAKNDFIRIANHQLNTPLSIMKNAYTLVQEKTISAKEGNQYWKDGLDRLSQVVENFWNVLQTEEGMLKNPQKTDIVAMIEDIIQAKKKMLHAMKKNMKILTQEPQMGIPSVWCDQRQIKNVLDNLIDNAIFYSLKGSVVISYELVQKNDFLKINIKDTGIGISEADQLKLGEKFYRGKNAALYHTDGSGLGLYICKKIVENNNGELTYFSEGENKGSIFSITVPVHN
jgi:nitrogen-specific signal transduction histidine kinase